MRLRFDIQAYLREGLKVKQGDGWVIRLGKLEKRGRSYLSSRGLFGSHFFVFGPIELIF